MKKLILIELNEINFDVIGDYIKSGLHLPTFKKILDERLVTTIAEEQYHNLEPWIQWVSVHTGKTYSEHGIFRLGDAINLTHDQIFEKIEKAGFRVGAVSPMNAVNKLTDPAYFIPDPWTNTKSDNSFLSQRIAGAISQAVNDNSNSKLTIKTIMSICFACLCLLRPKKYIKLFKYAFSSFGKPWRKALFFDLLLHEFHYSLFLKTKPHFSTLFLNAGAHIQHHYFFNSKFVNSQLSNPTWYIKDSLDPVQEMLTVYDGILEDIFNIPNIEIIIATGLSQSPYKELKYYYRLNNHQSFIKDLNIEFSSIYPRMTRDFLISFESEILASKAEEKLSKILINNKDKLFGEIDNRGNELFVVLTYPYEVTQNTIVQLEHKEVKLIDHVSFVAIKNGEHQGKGFAYFSSGISESIPNNEEHVSKIHNTIVNFF